MSKLKRAVAASAAAAGLTLGAFAVAAPASAVAVKYNCGAYGTINADYSNNGNDFELIADVSSIYPGSTSFDLAAGSTATWNGPPSVTVGVTGSVFPPYAILNGTSTAAPTGAPNSITIMIPSPPAPGPGPLAVTCTKV